jgi:VanZ family protein
LLRLLNLLNKFLVSQKWIIFLYWIITIILLTLPGNKFPTKNWFKIYHVDKWIHIGLFCGLTFFSFAIFTKLTKHKTNFIATICFMFGVAIEFVQEAYIVNRSFDNWDIIADGLGVLISFFIFKILQKKQLV